MCHDSMCGECHHVHNNITCFLMLSTRFVCLSMFFLLSGLNLCSKPTPGPCLLTDREVAWHQRRQKAFRPQIPKASQTNTSFHNSPLSMRGPHPTTSINTFTSFPRTSDRINIVETKINTLNQNSLNVGSFITKN